MGFELIKKRSFKITLLIYFALAYPIYMFSTAMFYSLTCLMILRILLFWDSKLSKFESKDSLDWTTYKIYFPWIQVIVIWYFIINVMNLVIDLGFGYTTKPVLFFVWALVLVTIYYVWKNIRAVLFEIKTLANTKNLFNKKNLLFVLVSVFIIFIMPDIGFGIGYKLFLSVFSNIDIGLLQCTYLSMIISNTLPVGEGYIEYIDLISNNTYIYTYQMVHVVLNKIVNVIVIGIVFNYIFKAVDIGRNNKKFIE